MQGFRRSLAFDLSVFTVSCTVLGYFVWHGFYGPRSFEHRDLVRAEVVKYQNAEKKAEEERDQRNAHVSLLRSRSIDPDLLDEVARTELGFYGENDLILLNRSN